MAANYNETKSATWALGLFRSNSDVFGDDLGDNGEKSVTGRTTWLPLYDQSAQGRHLAHLGASYSFRDADNDSVRFHAQPEIRSHNTTPPAPSFVDTLAIPAHGHQLFGLEAAVVRGPFSMQWEYMLVPVDRLSGDDPIFHGTYWYASYFLTGEHRPYRRESGTFDRVMPFEEFFLIRTGRGVCAGWGAWEVAARISFVDLDDAGVLGGELTELTLGLNWYMNPYTRISTNYAHAYLDRPPVGESTCDMLGIRANFDF
jgi:phosphate-selective porin OprO/OprP